MNGRRAVVIGAGLGGLAAALRLASCGWQITLLERQDRAGGKMNLHVESGFRFDTGPSLLTLPEVFRELLSLAGDCGPLAMHRVEPGARYCFADGTQFDYAASLPAWLGVLRRQWPGDESGFLHLMKLGANLFELSRATFFNQARGEPPAAEMLPALRQMPLRQGWGSYHTTVASHLRSPQLIQFFDRYPTYVGSSPFHTPATLLAIPYMEYAYGGHYVPGGLYRIIELLVACLRARGAEFHFGVTAEMIHTRNNRVHAVCDQDGREYRSDIVIYNGDAAQLDRLLGHVERKGERQPQRSLSGFVILLGIAGRLPQQTHHTVYFGGDYEREFTELFGEGLPAAFPSDPTVYVNCPSVTDTTIAPPGHSALFIMANAPSTESCIWDETQVALARHRVLQRLAASGLTGLEQRIVVEKVWTPQTLADSYDMPGGAIYGQASHGWRGAFLRPLNRPRHPRGLYLVGGSSHPGGGTPTVLMGAKIVQQLVQRYERT